VYASTTNEFQRFTSDGFLNAVITAADAATDPVSIPRVGCVGATFARIGCVCDTAGATLQGRWVLGDSQPNGGDAIGVSPRITFTAGASSLQAVIGNAGLTGPILATPNVDAIVNLGGAANLYFLIDAVSAGNWQLYGRMYYPFAAR